MSDSSSSGINEEALRAAEMERDIARAVADTEAVRRQEAERDAALKSAITQAAHRDAAELVARNEAYIRAEVEKAKLNAAIRANQARIAAGEAADDNARLRQRLVAERKAASTATFSLIIVSILLIACFVVGGFYLFSEQNNAPTGTSAGVNPGAVASAASPTRSTDVATPERTPTPIHVSAAPTLTSPAAQPTGSGVQTTPPPSLQNSGKLSGGTIDPMHSSLGSDAGSLSGSALGSDSTPGNTGGSTTDDAGAGATTQGTSP